MKYLKKYKLRIILLCMICLNIYVMSNIVSICVFSDKYVENECDVAIVLGAACSNEQVSEVYMQRLNQAYELIKKGKVKRIITTGGIGQGNTISDASIAKKYLEECGVPEYLIFVEENSTTTQENLEKSNAIMVENNYKSALIVSDPLHMKRAMLIAKDVGIDAYSSPTKTSAYKTWEKRVPFMVRETFFLIAYKCYKIINFGEE